MGRYKGSFTVKIFCWQGPGNLCRAEVSFGVFLKLLYTSPPLSWEESLADARRWIRERGYTRNLDNSPPPPRGPRPAGSGWVAEETKPGLVNLTDTEWLAERLKQAALMLKTCVEVNPKKRAGIPVVKGTRITIAQVLAELADDQRISELADDFEIPVDLLRNFLEGLAIYLDQSASNDDLPV